MILINLLPHREMARKKARQAFNTALGLSALAGLAIAGGIFLWYQHQLSEQQDRNAFISSEITKLDAEIKEVANLQGEIAALKARQEAVENLQADRNLPVHLMNEAVKQLPDNQNVLFTGVAQSNERVSELLRNLERNSDWVTKPELIEIVAANMALSPREQKRVYNFTVRVQLQRASAPASGVSAAART